MPELNSLETAWAAFKNMMDPLVNSQTYDRGWVGAHQHKTPLNTPCVNSQPLADNDDRPHKRRRMPSGSPPADQQFPSEYDVNPSSGKRTAQLRPVTSQTTAVAEQQDMIRYSMEIRNFVDPLPREINRIDARPLKRLFKLILASSNFQVLT